MNRDDRDRATDALLRTILRDNREAAPGVCLDAETAAAWIDGALGAEERRSIEPHVAACARCQTLLASIARSAPPIERVPLWRRARVPWLVPAGALAALSVFIWTSVDSQRAPKTPSPAAHVTSAPSQPAPQAEGVRAKNEEQAGRALKDTAPTDLKKEAPLRTDESAPGRERAQLRDSPRQESQNKVKTVPESGVRAAEPAVPPLSETVTLPQTATPQPAPPAAAAAAPAATPPANQAAAAKPSAVAGNAKALESRPAGRFAATDALAPVADIVAPDATYRWRIVNRSAVTRSVDGGGTWRAQALPPGAEPNAGSAPASAVCWLVGRAGLVLLTIDGGQTWQRLTAPVTADLVQVAATSADAATVTSADGRAFATTDRAKTWSVIRNP